LTNFLFTTLIVPAIALAYTLNAYGEPPDHTVAGYYISWGAYGRNYTPRDIDATKLTHIIYAFANIDKGEVTLGDVGADPRNFAELRRLKSQNDRLKLVIAVGGWVGSKHFSDSASTEDSRKRLADSAVTFLRDHGFDGIDLDWEYPVAGGRDANVRPPKTGKTLPCCCRRSERRSTRPARRTESNTSLRSQRADRTNTSPTLNWTK
jgi:chitinase